jgi:hypothetical protein
MLRTRARTLAEFGANSTAENRQNRAASRVHAMGNRACNRLIASNLNGLLLTIHKQAVTNTRRTPRDGRSTGWGLRSSARREGGPGGKIEARRPISTLPRALSLLKIFTSENFSARRIFGGLHD